MIAIFWAPNRDIAGCTSKLYCRRDFDGISLMVRQHVMVFAS